MKIEFLCRNYTASEKLKALIEKKLEKLDKFFDEAAKAKVVLKQSKDIESLEVTIGFSGVIIRAEVSGDNMYENIDVVVPKIEKQIIKHHSKLKSKKIRVRDEAIAESVIEREPAKKVVRSKSFDLVPMTVEDAMEELELIGHNFYVFLNKASGSISVVYLRNDGDYGLIETKTF